ncbi:hypothetical protein B0J15DRAFT_595194 [Fusarium solani]|uniref:Uncharacterized protein n=1 Tax=Fusarium solani TaxID=169388 RepID=A0A9P9HBV5_FUSSL|nr:uncharacterized protein B0J15DRAFT_595194 [Fusarium solani]KAH7254770.1 hypothetical protein B0J15DRAFT_595194 [Fusarium solani]
MTPLTSLCTSCYTAEGHSVALVDTPSFDDMYRSDTEALTDVIYFLAQTYLAGITYIDRIFDNLMTGSFEEPIHVPGTLWQKGRYISSRPGNFHVGQTRQRSKRCHPRCSGMISLRDGCCASSITSGLFLFSNTVLEIQHEMVVGKRFLNKTRAGKKLLKDLSAESVKHEKNLADVKRSHQEALSTGA